MYMYYPVLEILNLIDMIVQCYIQLQLLLETTCNNVGVFVNTLLLKNNYPPVLGYATVF